MGIWEGPATGPGPAWGIKGYGKLISACSDSQRGSPVLTSWPAIGKASGGRPCPNRIHCPSGLR